MEGTKEQGLRNGGKGACSRSRERGPVDGFLDIRYGARVTVAQAAAVQRLGSDGRHDYAGPAAAGAPASSLWFRVPLCRELESWRKRQRTGSSFPAFSLRPKLQRGCQWPDRPAASVTVASGRGRVSLSAQNAEGRA